MKLRRRIAAHRYVRWIFAASSGLVLAACGAAAPEGAEEQSQELAAATYNFGTLAAPGKCMDVSGGSSADGANIQQWQCNGSGAQSFRVENLSNGAARLINTSSNKCVDVSGMGTADGTKVQLWTCNNSAAQSFRVDNLANSNVRFVNTNSNKCLDVAAAGTADGTKIQLWSCNGTNAQTFHPAVIGGGVVTPPSACKRGIASNVAPGAELSASVKWWYDWGNGPSGASNAEFVPMMWDERAVNASIPAGAKFLLGFNEPNFKSQADLTPAQAASYWGTVQQRARAAGIPIVSPAVNFCGPASNCNGTSPYDWLKQFFAACPGCEVDYVAVHWYNCDLPSLKDYLEPGGGLEGFEQFGKPIWLTEFACAIGGDTSPAGQEAYIRAAIPYLESNPHVFRYSWFSADPIPNARLLNGDGTPTALGRVYESLPQSCQ